MYLCTFCAHVYELEACDARKKSVIVQLFMAISKILYDVLLLYLKVTIIYGYKF